MRVDYGDKGYGRYWMIVETLAEASEYKLKLNNGNIKGISLSLNIPYKQLEKFINDCIEKYKLFVKDKSGEYFYSESLLKRLRMRDNITERLVEAGQKGANKRWKGHRVANNPFNEAPKEKKLYLDNVYISEEEMKKLNEQYDKNIIEDYIEKLNRYIAEYIVPGKRKPYQSHYLTIKAWIRKDEKKQLLEPGSFVEPDSYVNLREMEKGKK